MFRAGRQQQYWEQETSQVIQWLGVRLAMQGHKLDPWSRKISQATKPEPHNCWSARAQSPCSAHPGKPPQWEARAMQLEEARAMQLEKARAIQQRHSEAK